MTYFLTALAACIALVAGATAAQADDINKKGADTTIGSDRSVAQNVERTPPPSPLPLPYPTTGKATTAPAPRGATDVTSGNSAVVEPAQTAPNAKARDAASGVATGKRQHGIVRSP